MEVRRTETQTGGFGVNMNEIGKTKTPNAGEWWVRNDDGAMSS